MATTTASLTLTSTDLFDDSLSISNTSTCYKAGTTIGLDQTTGLTKTYVTAVTQFDPFAVVKGATNTAENGKVYIANLSEDETEFITVKIAGNIIGKLYAGDYLWMPWSQREDSHGDNHHGDITVAPSVATGMWLEWACINEGTEYPTENLATA